MGNKQINVVSSTKEELNYKRFVTQEKDYIIEKQNQDYQLNQQNCITIEPFQCLNVSKDKSRQRFMDIQVNQSSIIITKYFNKIQNLQFYISNVIKISKMLSIVLYDQIKFILNESPFTSTLSININNFRRLDAEFVRKSNLQKKMDLLQYVSYLLKSVKSIYICPQFIAEGASSFHLLDYSISCNFSPQMIFLGFLRWVFSDYFDFQICLSVEDMPSNMPIYLQEIYNSIYYLKSLNITQIQSQLKSIKDKMFFLLSKTDSLYACQFYNKIQKYLSKSDWIFMKSRHQIFFYHIKDKHPFTGKLIRKKKKKDIDQCHITFDPQDLEVLYVPQNCKFIVKASQFQFQSSTSISDIQIKYKLPVKFKNCLISRARNGDLFLLQQYLYRFVPSQNKLIQQSKRISDYIYLTSTRQSSSFIVKMSIDIFRNGIRIFYKNQDIILALTGDQKIISQISSIRIDIRQVIFCIQVYKGVFLMMASKNMWILDLNFQCFFSYATPAQLKKLATFTQNNSNPSNKHNDQLFTIIDQPFKVDLSSHNDGNNVAIKNNLLHILGYIEGHPYYLRYKFIHRIGALKLQGYHPLFVQSPFLDINLKSQKKQVQFYRFNFHQQNSNIYKYQSWIFKGKFLVKVYDFDIKFQKSNYEVNLKIQKLQQNLKQHIQKINKSLKKLKRQQTLLLLFKVYQIFEYLLLNSITHRNISINHLCFTSSKELKLHGWSEPARNWHVSDYKDYMLVCFNIITCNTYQKLSDKIILKHENQLNQFNIISDKIHQAFKQSKTIQKHAQIEKNMQILKSYFEKQLSVVLNQIKTNKFIFSFEYKTPRMSIFNTQTQKLKKITIIPEETIAEEFIFNQTDRFVWNQQACKLYIFTACHHFYQLKIDVENISQQKLILEDYQYLPHNVSSSTFINVKGQNLYSFGGVKKETDGRSTYCKNIYKFNWKSLTWQIICQLPQARINPHAVISICKGYIYLIGGVREHECQHLKIIKFDIKKNKCHLLIDRSSLNIISNLGCLLPMKIFHISQQLGIFMFWSLEQGDYVIKYVCYTSLGFQIQIRVKNYSNQNLICGQSVGLQNNFIHILRPYGKYTKITIQKLQSASIKNDTIYAI